MPSNGIESNRPGPIRSELLPADTMVAGRLISLLRESVAGRISQHSWLIYLLLISGLGPVTIWSRNLDRIMIETVLVGIVLLFTSLVVLRILVAAVIRRPSVTDPMLAILAIAGLYDRLFAVNAGVTMILMWWVVCSLLVILVIALPGFRAAMPQALCIFLTLSNLMILSTVVWHGDGGRRAELRAALADHYPPLPAPDAISRRARPDVYFLVFDRYARADQLANHYDFDNSDFLAALRARGFQVSDGSYSAYQRTAHSLVSTLNLDYLPEIDGPASGDWVPLYERLREPRLYPFLKAQGYRLVTMGSWWEPTRRSPLADRNLSVLAVPESIRPLIEQSAIARSLASTTIPWISPRARQCARIKRKFEELGKVASADAPVFVFAHFLVPHPPYVVDSQGACKTAQQAGLMSRRDNYIAQLRYTNAAVLSLIDTVLAQNQDALIILQSDEGPWPQRYAGEEIARFGTDVTSVDWKAASAGELREKMAILNAIRLPDGPSTSIGSDFAPVNTFRLVLRDYFGVGLADREVRTWVFAGDLDLWTFRDVADELAGADP